MGEHSYLEDQRDTSFISNFIIFCYQKRMMIIVLYELLLHNAASPAHRQHVTKNN
jgi:hypothetical protein